MKYQVKLIYKYSDTIEVEADSEEEAIEKAQSSPDIEETYESYYYAEATEEIREEDIEHDDEDFFFGDNDDWIHGNSGMVGDD